MISIIIPLYNVQNYLLLCLNSLKEQIYKNFEIIIVNDGSTDNSEQIVKDYMKNSKMNIRLFNQENGGVCAARNKGISESCGEYLCFVDPDDMVAPDYLSQMIEIIDKEKCDLVICGIKSVPEDSIVSTHVYKRHTITTMNSYEALKKYLYQDIVSGIWSLMVSSKIIRLHNLRFAEGYRYGEDTEMVYKIIAHSGIVAYTKDQLYLYRVRYSSAMSILGDTRIEGFKLIQGLESYFNKFRTDFSDEFYRYGTARYVWANIWQTALGSVNYKSFSIDSNRLYAKKYMKKLFTYPKIYVALSSIIFSICPFLYYCFMKKIAKRRLRGRAISSLES